MITTTRGEYEEEKEAVGIEFIEQKADPKNAINLNGLIYKEKMRKTLLRLTCLGVYKSKLIKKIFLKK